MVQDKLRHLTDYSVTSQELSSFHKGTGPETFRKHYRRDSCKGSVYVTDIFTNKSPKYFHLALQSLWILFFFDPTGCFILEPHADV